MELYMDLATTTSESVSTTPLGLGFLDLNSSMLELDLLISPRRPPSTGSTNDTSGLTDSRSLKVVGKGASHRVSKSRGTTKDEKRRGGGGGGEEIAISVKLQQDLAALKGRKGDTGEF
jgi:hypothetical protein